MGNVWLFKLKDQKLLDGFDSGKTIYAVAVNKELAKGFMDQRNMNLFDYRKEFVDENEMEEFIQEFRDVMIEKNDLTTSFVRKDGRIDHTEVPIYTTDIEYTIAVRGAECVVRSLDEDNWLPVIPPECYIKELQELLYDISYNDYYNIYNGMTITGENNSDFSSPDLFLDELNCFIRIYGKTMASI